MKIPVATSLYLLGLGAQAAADADVSSFEFAATFQDDPFGKGDWVQSSAEKYEGQNFEVRASTVEGISDDKELVLIDANKHYGLATLFKDSITNKDKDLVVQYEVALTEGLNCGGAYIKLLRTAEGVDSLTNDTPYSIMFGPDKCGATDKVHFILQHRSPVTGEWEEKHLKDAPRTKGDKKHHLYTLVLRPSDSTYEILIDTKSESKGSLLEAMTPSINPPTMIDDPDDKKPADWVDEAKIKDPAAVKPDDWDESAPPKILDDTAEMPSGWLVDTPLFVPDPEASKPDDWDDEEDGEWEAPGIANPECDAAPGCGEWNPPMVANPAYKGIWIAPMIDNPDYIGEWEPKQIENPNYFEEKEPAVVAPLTGLAVEIWTTNGGITMDNIVVGHDLKAALAFAEKTWRVKAAAEAAQAEKEQPQREEEGSLGSSSIKAKASAVAAQLTEHAYALLDKAKDAPMMLGATLGCLVVALYALFKTAPKRREERGVAEEDDVDEGVEETKASEPPSAPKQPAARAAAAPAAPAAVPPAPTPVEQEQDDGDDTDTD